MPENQLAAGIPVIRFRDFDQRWQKIQLNDVVEVIDTGKSTFNVVQERSGSHPYPVLGSRSIIGYEQSYDYSGDFILTARVGENAGRLYRHTGKAKISDNTVFIQCENSTFLFYLLTAFDLTKLAFGTGQPLIKSSELRGLTLSLPIKDSEQTQIGAYFKSLDRTIGLHQRRHDKLLTLKQAMLQKMFPQDGATAPEIRFKEFEGDWDTKTVGQMASFSKGQGYSKKDLRKNGVPIILYGRLYTAYETEITNVDTFADEQDGSVKSEGNEVIVPSSGESSEDIARASAVTQSGVILGGDLNVITPCGDLDPCFLALTLSYGKPQKDLAQKAQGKSVVHVRNSDIEPLEIPVTEIAEQQKIGTYFRNLDKLISKHATQLKKLENIKSACLEKMFV